MINQTQNPYHGLWVIVVISLAFPTALFFLFRMVVTRDSPDINLWTCVTIAGGCGTLMQLIIDITAGLGTHLKNMFSRVKGFFADCSLSVKVAWDCYVINVKETGLIIEVYFLLFLANLGMLAVGLRHLLPLLSV